MSDAESWTDTGETAPTLGLRALALDDLDAVLGIDRAAMGRSRRGFFEKRLQAAQQTPSAYVAVAAHENGRVVGFLIASLLEGEFGREAPVAILDALGVQSDRRGTGIARRMLEAFDTEIRTRGIREVYTEAAWNAPELLGFFEASGFTLAPRIVLERSTAAPVGF